jgi:hypothetical protein
VGAVEQRAQALGEAGHRARLPVEAGTGKRQRLTPKLKTR